WALATLVRLRRSHFPYAFYNSPISITQYKYSNYARVFGGFWCVSTGCVAVSVALLTSCSPQLFWWREK
ncbi:hypothetical protein OJ936_10985, partial [Streptococcus anginosus]|nr:hypothetical protein [Streptococcus anginosus]